MRERGESARVAPALSGVAVCSALSLSRRRGKKGVRHTNHDVLAVLEDSHHMLRLTEWFVFVWRSSFRTEVWDMT